MNAPLYVTHISTGLAGKILAERQSNGQIVYGEVLASAIGLTGDRRNIATITSPPLRSNSDATFQLLGLLAS